MNDITTLSSNAKLLLQYFNKNDTRKFDQLLEITDIQKESLTNALTELINKEYVVKYGDTYILILTDDQAWALQQYREKKLSEKLTHTVSFSKIKQLKSSKRKFYYKYIRRIYLQTEKSTALQFGSQAHNLIEDTFMSKETDEELKEMLFARIENLVSLFPEHQQDQFHARFYTVIQTILKMRKIYKAIELEKHINIVVEDISNDPQLVNVFTEITPAKYRTNDRKCTQLGFNGYIDGWMEDRKTGKKVIIDWKTGSYSQQKFRDYSKQLQIYAHLLRLIDEKPDTAFIVFIETGMSYEVNISAVTSKKTYDKFITFYKDTLRKGLDFENFKSCCSGALANYCEYKRICNVIDGTKLDMNLLQATILNNTKRF